MSAVPGRVARRAARVAACLSTLTFAAGLASAGAVAMAPAAHAAGCAAPRGLYTGTTPWAQRLIDAPRLWPLTEGAGQLVAVIGTGIDPGNPQFAPGQVLAEQTVGSGKASGDCDGRGTFAAGIVGAQPDSATTVAGIAPQARLLPIGYTASTSDESSAFGDPNALATAIDDAVQDHASVILVAVPAASDSAALRAAAMAAYQVGVVVVSPASGTQSGERSYPTADAGVIGVGAVDQAGGAVQSESGTYIKLAAPGADLVGTSAGAQGALAHEWPVSDPSFAAAYVAGTVALLRAYRPDLTPIQIRNRLTLTATPPPGGGDDPRLGWGTLDAYAAVTSDLPADAAAPGTGASPRPAHVAPAAPPARRDQGDALPAQLGLLAVAVAALLFVGVAALRRGRGRGWKPGRVRP